MSEHVFDAAKRMGYRGYFYFPTLEPSEQMPQWTRVNIAEKVNYLYWNFGAVQMVIDGLSLDETDTGIWPKATTSNPDFNREVTNDFHEECGEAKVFDEAGVENGYTQQFTIRRNIRLYGDLFGQMLRPGEGSSVASFKNVPMWQVRNASKTSLKQDEWKDGIRSNTAGKALQYRVMKNREGSSWEDVSASDMMHFHDPFLPGQKRGMSGLAAVARKLFTIDDIERAESNGVLLRARMAYAITRAPEDTGGPQVLPGAKVVEEIETRTGEKLLVQRVVASDGAEVDVADLPSGSTMNVVESNRAMASHEFTKTLMADVAYSQKYPPEYVFYLSGLGQGTVARLVLQRVQRVVNFVRQHQLIPQFLKPWYIFWLWQRIKSGKYDSIPGGVPKDWWKRKFICPALMTVDLGREGNLYDKRLESGKMSPATYHGMMGEDDEDVEDEIIAAAIRRHKKVQQAIANNPDIAAELKANPIFSNEKASAAPVAPPEPPPSDEEDEEDEDKNENKKNQ